MLYSFFLFVNKKKTHILFGFTNTFCGNENILSDTVKAVTSPPLFGLLTERVAPYKQQQINLI